MTITPTPRDNAGGKMSITPRIRRIIEGVALILAGLVVTFLLTAMAWRLGGGWDLLGKRLAPFAAIPLMTIGTFRILHDGRRKVVIRVDAITRRYAESQGIDVAALVATFAPNAAHDKGDRWEAGDIGWQAGIRDGWGWLWTPRIKLSDNVSYRPPVRHWEEDANDWAPTLVVDDRLPETILSAASGMRVRELVDHPWLEDATVRDAQHATADDGISITLIRMDVPWTEHEAIG